MSNRKQTKRALLTSIMALVMCVVMLVGATFAWFTDTVSTNVNKIEAGKLDVQLLMSTDGGANWSPAEGETLNFIKAPEGVAAGQMTILWEPGATYDLPLLKIVNNGNLKLKYKVAISGATGDVELLDVIDFNATVTNVDNTTTVISNVNVKDNPAMVVDKVLDPTAFEIIALSGTMKTSANNHYMDMKVEGIAITVYATQAIGEYDSSVNDYDKDAQYPVAATTAVTVGDDNKTDKIYTAESVEKVNTTTPVAKVTIPQGVEMAAGTKQVTLTVNETAEPANFSVDVGLTAKSFEIKMSEVVPGNTEKMIVELYVGKDLNNPKMYHNGVAMDAVDYSYNAATGVMTIYTASFSPFTVVSSNSVFDGGDGTAEHPYLISTGEQAYMMRDKIYKGYFKLTKDVVVTNEIYLSSKTCVVDLNGHSVTLEYAADVKPNNGGVFNIAGKKSNLTINDSSAEQTGAVIGSDKSYTNKVTSAVRVGNYGKLTINGGHFYGMSEDTSCIFVMTSTASGSKATVTINGGTFETASALNGTYYVLNHQDSATTGCTITVNGGSFKNYNPGVTVVDPVNAKTGKIILGEGCTTASVETDGAIWYTVSK